MIRRRRLRLTPGTDRTLPDPQDPALPQVSPSQPVPVAPVPPPESTPDPAVPDDAPPPPPTPERPPAPPDDPDDHTASPAPAAPLQLELRRVPTDTAANFDTDLPSPKDDRIARPVTHGVWLRTDDDDRLLRHSARENLWTLQRSQRRRPAPQPAL